jgi:ArsR family transcriptional regulator
MATATRSPVDQGLLRRLQALADEKRLAVVERLREGEHCVCDLQEVVGASQSLLSHHLRVLREAGLVSDRKEGRWVHYSLVPEALAEVEEFLEKARTAAESAGTGVECCG